MNQIRKKYENGEITYQEYQEFISGQKAGTIETNNQSVVIKESGERKIPSPPLSSETPIENTTNKTSINVYHVGIIVFGFFICLGLVFLISSYYNHFVSMSMSMRDVNDLISSFIVLLLFIIGFVYCWEKNKKLKKM